MKKVLMALIFTCASTAFAGGKNTVPSCKSLVQNTVGIVTLKPIRSSTNPIQAGSKVIFSAAVEGVDIGFCAGRIVVEFGQLFIEGLEDLMKAGFCVIEGAANILFTILQGIFGHL